MARCVGRSMSVCYRCCYSEVGQLQVIERKIDRTWACHSATDNYARLHRITKGQRSVVLAFASTIPFIAPLISPNVKRSNKA